MKMSAFKTQLWSWIKKWRFPKIMRTSQKSGKHKLRLKMANLKFWKIRMNLCYKKQKSRERKSKNCQVNWPLWKQHCKQPMQLKSNFSINMTSLKKKRIKLRVTITKCMPNLQPYKARMITVWEKLRNWESLLPN